VSGVVAGRVPGVARGWLEVLNTTWHRRALAVYMVVVVAHWLEHLTQAAQIYVFGWPVHHAGGALGLAFPWLVHSEWLHYGYALAMLVGLALLRPGFVGRAKTWWTVSLAIQVWHHFEHLLLLVQALTGTSIGSGKPTSLVQLLIPRVELHLFYNAIVFVPMLVAVLLHRKPSTAERDLAKCGCAVPA
jgi:hypothetical protein